MAQTELVVPREEASSRISERIAAGEELLGRKLSGEPDLKRCRAEYKTWTDYNERLLQRLFSTTELSEEYRASYGVVGRINPTFSDRVHSLERDIEHDLDSLRSILERLDLFDVSESMPSPVRSPAGSRGADVFLVHGHDNEAKQTVARFLEKLGLTVTILHEQPNKGRTIIEKFEDHSHVSYAVVLLTADDVGAVKTHAANLNARARQNVVLELGFFIGALGRQNVCALLELGVEIPSDYLGVLYVELDDKEAWRLTLVRELRAAGMDVDLNGAV